MGFQKSKVPPGGSTAITAFITPLRRFLSNSDPSHQEARSAEGATGTREKRRGAPKARPGPSKEARSAEGATGTKQRGEERRRRDRDQAKRRGAPKARPGPSKEARSAEGATGTKQRGEERRRRDRDQAKRRGAPWG